MSKEITLPADIEIFPTSKWAKLPTIGGVLGVIGLVVTLGAAQSESTRTRAMFSYLWAFEVFLGVALGALGFLLIDYVVRAGWSVSLRRITETLAATLPLFVILFIPIATIGFHALYPWTHETDAILERKRWFLSPHFWYLRSALYLLVWTAISTYFYRNSLRQDVLGADHAKRDAISRKLRKVAAGMIPIWAVTLSFASFDWIKSLSPHWYSTIFGVYLFSASILAFFALTTLIALGLQRGGMMRTAVTTEHFHDLGKYTFGFTVFWAYIAFSQFILIWYANIPEEVVYYLTRTNGGWAPISYSLPIAHFLVPFLFLLSRHVKRNRFALAFASVWTLGVYLVDMYWLVLPNLGTEGLHFQHAHFSLSWFDLSALAGVGGAFFAVFGALLKRHKVVAINDPRLPEALAHETY